MCMRAYMHVIRVTGSEDCSIRVWSTASWECVTIIAAAHAGVYNGALFTCLACLPSFVSSGPVTSLQLEGAFFFSGSTDK